MKHLNSLIVSILKKHELLEENEVMLLKKELDENSNQFTHPTISKVYDFLKSPFGLILTILGYSKLNSYLTKTSIDQENTSVENDFKSMLKQQIFTEILEEK